MTVNLVERRLQRKLRNHLRPGERIRVAGTAQLPIKLRTIVKASAKGLAVGIPVALFSGLGIGVVPRSILFAITEDRLLFAADDVVSVLRSEIEITLRKSRAIDGPLNSTMSVRFADGESADLVVGPIVSRKIRVALANPGEA